MDPQEDSTHKTLDNLCKVTGQVFTDEKGIVFSMEGQARASLCQ